MSSTNKSEWTTEEIVLVPLLTFITVVTVLGNSFVLFLFIKGKKLRTPSHFLLANLALADLLVGVFVMPILSSITISTGHQWHFGRFTCAASDYVHYVFCATSMLSTIAVGVERLIGVKWPLEHKLIVTRGRVKFAVVMVWILAAALAWVPLSAWPTTGEVLLKIPGDIHICTGNTRKEFMRFMGFIVHLLPLGVVVGLYVAIVIVARKQLDVRNLTGSETNRALKTKAREVKLTKRVALLTATIFFMFGPLCIFLILNGVGSPEISTSTILLLMWIRFFNSTVNPLIYAFSVPGYRAEFIGLLTSKQTSNNSGGGGMINSSSNYNSAEDSL